MITGASARAAEAIAKQVNDRIEGIQATASERDEIRVMVAVEIIKATS